MLVYPEISDKEEYDELHAMVEPLERFFAESGNMWFILESLNVVFMFIYLFIIMLMYAYLFTYCLHFCCVYIYIMYSWFDLI